MKLSKTEFESLKEDTLIDLRVIGHKISSLMQSLSRKPDESKNFTEAFDLLIEVSCKIESAISYIENAKPEPEPTHERAN